MYIIYGVFFWVEKKNNFFKKEVFKNISYLCRSKISRIIGIGMFVMKRRTLEKALKSIPVNI